MPNKVIVIDTEVKHNVEGKTYKSFADAMDWIMKSSETLERPAFKVELPAGDFDESVVLDEKWTVHGNDTTLTQKVKTISKLRKL